jgi:hypothetical protein
MKKALILCIILASYSIAAEKQNLGGHFKPVDDAAMRVIDEKCLVCHNRQRIDQAVRERRDMEKIQRLMERKGAVLTPKEREVMGHFWKQNPLREKKERVKEQRL